MSLNHSLTFKKNIFTKLYKSSDDSSNLNICNLCIFTVSILLFFSYIINFTANFEKERKEIFCDIPAKSRKCIFLQTQVHSYFLNLFLESADKNNFLMQLLYLRQRGGGHPPPSTQII